jgi:hypothetical protein
MKKVLVPLLFVLGFTSCEDPVEIEVENGVSQISVDAFINNLPTAQTIYLKRSKNFFDKASQTPILGATVKVVNSDGQVYSFIDADQKGEYTWIDSTIVKEGLTYNLEVTIDGELYTSEEIANPVPTIDSLITGPIEGGFGGNEPNDTEFQLEMIVYDIPNRTDFYWVKVLRNDTLQNGPSDINVEIDAGGSSGSDGLLFIPPARIFAINNFGRPYNAGENVKIEIHSINYNTYLFFNQVRNQINNSGLFAVPSSNVRTNIESSSSETSKRAIGMFSISMVSSAGIDL